MFAEGLCAVHPFFAAIAACLHAARLDCLLEAAIAGWDLDLVSPGEESLMWWWIERICRARSQLVLAESWESIWAEAWGDVAQAMRNVSVSFAALAESVISCDRYLCRTLRFALQMGNQGGRSGFV